MQGYMMTAIKHQGYSRDCSQQAVTRLSNLIGGSLKGNYFNDEAAMIVRYQEDAAFHALVARNAMERKA